MSSPGKLPKPLGITIDHGSPWEAMAVIFTAFIVFAVVLWFVLNAI